MTNNYSDKIAKWALSNPGKLWEDNPRAAAVRQWLRVNEPKKLIELYNSEPEHIKKRIDKRFLPDGVAKEMFKNNVRSVIDSSGRNIFKVVDNVTGFIPGPVGAINWIGHLGSDIITGNPYKAARDILMSAAVGASGKLVSRIGRRLLKNARSGRGVNSGMHGESNGHIDVQPVEVSAGRDLTETVSLPNEAKNIIDDRYGNLRLIRNIRGVPYGNLENGITLAPQKNIFGNFTTDLPFRLHYDYQSMPGGEVMLVDPKALSGKTPWNIDVMDTFFRAND